MNNLRSFKRSERKITPQKSEKVPQFCQVVNILHKSVVFEEHHVYLYFFCYILKYYIVTITSPKEVKKFSIFGRQSKFCIHLWFSSSTIQICIFFNILEYYIVAINSRISCNDKSSISSYSSPESSISIRSMSSLIISSVAP